MSECQSCSCSHDHNHEHNHSHNELIFALIGLMFLLSGLVLEYLHIAWFENNKLITALWFLTPLIGIITPMLKEMVQLFAKKDFFNEITLMLMAMIGATIIGKYAESLGIMVFYTIGEYFQSSAVKKANKSIKSLLDLRPDVAYLVQNDQSISAVEPQSVEINSILEIPTGGRVPLDGELISSDTYMNTLALTGESRPRLVKKGESILSGMVAQDIIRIKVTKTYQDSTLSRILYMVQDASSRKSPTEQMIRKLARIYTPTVFFLSLLVIILPFIFLGSNYDFQTWFYRSLVFLVISCPCALVISIPLGYYGGIGLGSSYGILFKGGNYLEAISHLKLLITDKTGTMTKGVFTVQRVISTLWDMNQLISYVSGIEKKSTHPIAKAIVSYAKQKNIDPVEIHNIKEISGQGLTASLDHKLFIAGNKLLLETHHIEIPAEYQETSGSIVWVAYDNQFAGLIEVSDEIKEDAPETIEKLHKLGVTIIMLSGDRKSVTKSVAETLGITKYHGELLPDQKVELLQQYKNNNPYVSAFVGDGINDAPALALSDVGIAMGGLGSDVAIETADIVIQTDEPSKIVLAIHIAKATKYIVWQNIIFALAMKVLFLTLGTLGLSGLWEAIFADVGVSLLAILNALRLQKKKFH